MTEQIMSQIDGWDGDYDISQAQYRVILEISGFKLRKPLEIALFEEFGHGGLKIGYKAEHTLPSLNKKEEHVLYGQGRTEDEAAYNLRELISVFYSNIESSLSQLGPEQQIQWQYLSSIMAREEDSKI